MDTNTEPENTRYVIKYKVRRNTEETEFWTYWNKLQPEGFVNDKELAIPFPTKAIADAFAGFRPGNAAELYFGDDTYSILDSKIEAVKNHPGTLLNFWQVPWDTIAWPDEEKSLLKKNARQWRFCPGPIIAELFALNAKISKWNYGDYHLPTVVRWYNLCHRLDPDGFRKAYFGKRLFIGKTFFNQFPIYNLLNWGKHKDGCTHEVVAVTLHSFVDGAFTVQSDCGHIFSMHLQYDGHAFWDYDEVMKLWNPLE